MSQLSTVSVQQKYGLVKKGGTSSKPNPPQRQLRPSAFSDALEDDDDDDAQNKKGPQDIRKMSYEFHKRTQASNSVIDSNAAAALAEDPSVFDYDGTYDSFSAQREAEVAEKESQKQHEPVKARYINNLMTTAKVREKERERIYEKKLLKERLIEDEQFGEQPKFLTTAYKQKLLENQQWEYEDKLAEELEKRQDVRKIGMQGFYSNLLTKNVAIGGNVSNAISAYTVGSNRQSHIVDKVEATAETPTEEDVQVKPLKSLETKGSEAKHTTEEILTALDIAKESKIQKSDQEDVPSSKLDAAVPQKSKQELLEAARERYLARKRNVTSMLED